jgi:hypothetical protein
MKFVEGDWPESLSWKVTPTTTHHTPSPFTTHHHPPSLTNQHTPFTKLQSSLQPHCALAAQRTALNVSSTDELVLS